MAPEKDPQSGHSADERISTSEEQWVISDVEVTSRTEQVIITTGSEEMPSSTKKVRPPRKQQLRHRNMQQIGGKDMLLVDMEEERLDIPPLQNTTKKRRKKMQKLNEEVARLEQIVFRDTAPLIQNIDMCDVGLMEEVVTSLEQEWCREGNTAAATLASLEKEEGSEIQPAWIDDEEENLTVDMALAVTNIGKRRKTPMPVTSKTDKYEKLLKNQFESYVGTPNWAKLDNKMKISEDGQNDSLDRHCGELLTNSSTLAPTKLQFRRVADLTEKGSSKRTIITAVDFHPKNQAAVVTNRPGLATFYQVDGENNTRIQSVKFENFPINTAKFLVDGSELLLGSEYRTHLLCYDMTTGVSSHVPCPITGAEINNMSKFTLSPDGRMLGVSGRDGSIILMTARTREWVGTVKMSGKCHALTFNSNGSQLLTYGKEGHVYVWDVAERRCIHRFRDEGCLQGLSLATSPNDQYVACGSGSGVVNIYRGSTVLPDSQAFLWDNPTPAKAIMNLTTAAHQVVFNSTSQLLATVSRCKDSAVKLVHLPSLTVYANFPTRDLDLARPEVTAFSPNGGYLAVGNNIGAVRLIRLEHFANY